MNIVSTIPKGKFKDWPTAERVCRMCDGTTDRGDGEWFWLINCKALPSKLKPGSVCFMIYAGIVRGYFDIVDTDKSENWREKHPLGKERSTECIVMANWHPIGDGQLMTGFQGYRYTPMRP